MLVIDNLAGVSRSNCVRCMSILLLFGSILSRGVRITSRSSYRTTEQLDSSSEDDDDSDGTPGPPAALVWGKRDKLYKPAGISQKQKGGMSNSGLISRNGTKTKAESIVCSIANGADMKPWDRSTSATGIVHVKRPKYLDCQSEQIGAWRKKKTSKTKHNLSFDKTGNVKGYSSIMRSQMDIAIRAAELSRHTEYKETDREKLGVDDLTGDDVILDILENAVLILDDNGDENESIYGYFVDEPCPASSTQRSRARNSDESRVPMELPTKPPVVERGVANNKAIVNTTDEHSMQGPSRVNENTLSKRPESALSQAQAFSLPARVTRRSGSVYAGEKKGRTSEEMFQQIASRNESRPWNSIAKGRRMTNEGNMVDAAEEQRLKEQSKKFYREQLQLERDVFGFDHTPYTPDFVPAESPEPEEEVEHNNHCSTCSFGGMLVMCEDCPKSFHLLCAEPPLHRVPKEDWLCCTCKHAKALEDQTENKLTRKDYTGLDSATPWDMLIVSGTRKNPISMELPYTINEDVKYEPYAPWLPPSQLPIQRTVEKEESVSKNKCTMCYRGSAMEKGWKCPAHVDHPLGQLRRAGRLPLKPKNTWKSDIDIVEEFMDNAADHWKSRYENLRRKEVTVVDELAQLHLASVPTYEKRSILQLGLQQYMVDTTKEETSTDTLMIEFMEFCEATKSTHRVQRYLDIYNDSTVHQLATTECADTSETEVAEAAAEVS
ncbi:hypothetical protein, variant [Sphaeroforma arctica JP610]|uniref:PHD-type domain-containing protein n=1 Tax=Sphaeroforma arctica JP610 TaxID=667725 RepID=A0A0L0FSZ9_9EUKA|nr:hypothetical protein, variant [Sphaeroforma arctica JP610]KNC79078.1 hypothetical protein, variant [Sphaeroforma arctica JP610]|eukprot:XP_014152980.1 hypothetical protein, variant [Sphaeroforma arctica JP610]